MQELKSKMLQFVEKNETKLEVGFFLGGFLFDILLLTDPDDVFGLIQQVVYLAAVGALLHYEILFRLQKWRPGRFLKRAWAYRNLALHFLFGSLLNLYSLFYIKSASVVSSIAFLALMLAIILANELPIVKRAKVSLKIALYVICLISFFSILFPLLIGFVGWTSFSLALLTTGAAVVFHLRRLQQAIQDQAVLRRALLAPSAATLALFLGFYVLGWIPPVPLSVKEHGIYHAIEKRNGHYYLSFEKVWWKFWQTSDSVFRARPGDSLYFYAQVYSPTRISDQVVLHWLLKDARRGWLTSDKISMSIQGGREAGFRGFAYKSNYQPGEWQVRVETTTGIEISRYSFEVVAAESAATTELSVLER